MTVYGYYKVFIRRATPTAPGGAINQCWMRVVELSYRSIHMHITMYLMDAHEYVYLYLCVSVCFCLIESGEASRFMGAVWIAQCGPVQVMYIKSNCLCKMYKK